MPITDTGYYMERGYEGSIATMEPRLVRGTFEELINGDSVRIPFGRAVRRHTDGTIRALTTAANVPWGITVRNNAYEPEADGSTGTPAGQPLTLLRKGAIYMVAEVAINHLTDSVFFRFDAQTTPGAFDAVGRVRINVNNDGSAHAVAAPAGCRFLESVAAGEVVAVYLDFGG